MSSGSSLQPKWRTSMLPLGDSIVLYGSLFVALGVHHWGLSSASAFLLEAVKFMPIVVVWLLLLWALDLYDLRTVRELPTLVENLLLISIVIWVLGSTYFSLTQSPFAIASKDVLPLSVMVAAPILLLLRRAWLRVCDFHLETQKVVFLGDREHVRMLQEGLEGMSHNTGFTPVAWSASDVDLLVADAQWIDEHWDEARDIFLAAVSQKLPIVSFEHFYESLLGKVSPVYASHPSWTLEFALHENKSLYPAFKRLLDVLASVMLLAFAAPVMAVIALAIWVTDGRPILYGQSRVGHLCREFTIWKFRTMKVSADSAGPFTSAKTGESLVTPIGAWLRRFRMDELPQLWNVLIGEMALVGPRPEWTREIRVLEQQIPNYHLRHLVKPGITGWAQVYFRATNNFQDSVEKLHYDLFYLKYFSVALDISILLKTFKRLFISDSRIRARPSLAAPVGRVKHHWARDFNSVAGRLVEQPHPGAPALLRRFFRGAAGL